MQQANKHPASKPCKTPPRQREPIRVVTTSDDEPAPTKPQLIFKTEVMRRVGFTYPTLWRWMRDGKFPMSFDVGSKSAWREDEIEAWLASRPRSTFKSKAGA